MVDLLENPFQQFIVTFLFLCFGGGIAYFIGWKKGEGPLALPPSNQRVSSFQYPFLFWNVSGLELCALIMCIGSLFLTIPSILYLLFSNFTQTIALYAGIYSCTIIVLLAYFFYRSGYKEKNELLLTGFRKNPLALVAFEWKCFSFKDLLYTYVTSTILYFSLFIFLTYLLRDFLQLPYPENPNQSSVTLLTTTNSLAGKILVVLFIGIIVPIFEEIIFRGVLHSFFRKRFSFSVALSLNIILFTLVHYEKNLGFALIPILCSIGIQSYAILALYERSQTLLGPILFHILMNLPTATHLAFFYSP